jgi:hypothetical protein
MAKKKSNMVKGGDVIPEGVKVLGFILFMGALISMFLALYMFNAADQFETLAAEANQMYGDTGISSGTFINLGLIFIVFALISYFIGRGILKLQNRARILLIVLLLLSLGVSVYNVFWLKQTYSGLFTSAINIVALGYLFMKNTVKVFK